MFAIIEPTLVSTKPNDIDIVNDCR